MTAKVLDGEALAELMREEVTAEVARLRAHGVQPGLGTILVGDDPASARYVALKHEDCAKVGIESVHEHLRPATRRRSCSPRSAGSTPTRPSTPSSSRSRCPEASTSSRPCSRSTPTRTSTGSTR